MAIKKHFLLTGQYRTYKSTMRIFSFVGFTLLITACAENTATNRAAPRAYYPAGATTTPTVESGTLNASATQGMNATATNTAGKSTASAQDSVENTPFFLYYDIKAGTSGGQLDTSEVRMYYRGALTDKIAVVGNVNGNASGAQKNKTVVLRQLRQQALQMKADGIYDVEYQDRGNTLYATGKAFRFKE